MWAKRFKLFFLGSVIFGGLGLFLVLNPLDFTGIQIACIQYPYCIAIIIWLYTIAVLPQIVRDSERARRQKLEEQAQNLDIPEHYTIGDDGEIVEVKPRRRFQKPW